MTTTIQTIQTKASELKTGMIVHFYGARFRLRDDRKEHFKVQGDELPVYTITGDWVDGNIERGYFGPERPWKFQGNDRASWMVEA
jgi:hypothetical protein